MTRKPAWRYKCDFCGKKSYSGGHMAKHEKHCTANDNRECRVCKLVEGKQRGMEELVMAAWCGIDVLREVAGGCPACMLSAIRRMPPLHSPGFHPLTHDGGDGLSAWDYKKAMKAAWDAFNERTQCY